MYICHTCKFFFPEKSFEISLMLSNLIMFISVQWVIPYTCYRLGIKQNVIINMLSQTNYRHGALVWRKWGKGSQKLTFFLLLLSENDLWYDRDNLSLCKSHCSVQHIMFLLRLITGNGFPRFSAFFLYSICHFNCFSYICAFSCFPVCISLYLLFLVSFIVIYLCFSFPYLNSKMLIRKKIIVFPFSPSPYNSFHFQGLQILWIGKKLEWIKWSIYAAWNFVNVDQSQSFKLLCTQNFLHLDCIY